MGAVVKCDYALPVCTLPNHYCLYVYRTGVRYITVIIDLPDAQETTSILMSSKIVEWFSSIHTVFISCSGHCCPMHHCDTIMGERAPGASPKLVIEEPLESKEGRCIILYY